MRTYLSEAICLFVMLVLPAPMGIAAPALGPLRVHPTNPRYCLANPGSEYLVYAPRGGEITVDLTPVSGALTVEWLRPVEGTTTPSAPLQGGSKRSLHAPFAGDAVLYLKTQQSEPKSRARS